MLGSCRQLKEAQALGVTYTRREKGRIADLLRDIDADEAKPLYNYLHDMPGMEAAAIPVLPKGIIVGECAMPPVRASTPAAVPVRVPFSTIITSRAAARGYRRGRRGAIVRANYAQGIDHYFVTDDNFARNRNWEAILDRLIELQNQQGHLRSS